MGLGRLAMRRPEDQATLASSILYFSRKSQESSHTYATMAEVTPHVATSTSSSSTTRARATSTPCLSPSASRPGGPRHMLLVLRHPQRSHRRLGGVGWRHGMCPSAPATSGLTSWTTLLTTRRDTTGHERLPAAP
jgi:hypothetical protein